MSVRDSFRDAFIQTAEQRHGRVATLLERVTDPPQAGGARQSRIADGGSELRAIASELHCLSGEAAMLDYARVADLARVAERAARAGELASLRRLVGELAAAIRALQPGADAR